MRLLQIALAVGEDTLRPTIPPNTPQALVSVAALCFEPEVDQRPNFDIIVQLLEHAVTTLPAEPDQGVFARMWSGGQKTPPASPPAPPATPQAARVST